MKKKILTLIFSVLFILPSIFILSACEKEETKIDFRVEGEYIQWTEDGTTWTNLIELEQLQGEQGLQGSQGVAGKQVEFQKTATYIQWKYVGDATWNNLIALDDIKGDDGEDASVVTYTVELNFSTPEYWSNSFTDFLFEDLIFANDIWMKDSMNLFELEEGYEYNKTSSSSDSGRFYYDVPSNEWIGDRLPDITKTEFYEYFEGWFVAGTDVEINQYSFIGGDVSLEMRWDEENMRKYFIRSAGIGPNGMAYAREDISPYTPHRKYVIIPEYYSETKITSIGACDYEDPSILKDVVFPCDNITSIGDKAFYNCTNLNRQEESSCVFQNLETIGESAFEGSGICDTWFLSSNNDKLFSIGANAFKDTIISSIYITKNVQTIGENAFSGCDSVKKVYIDSGYIANALTSNSVFGGLLLYADNVYLNEDLDVSSSTYLLENFTRQDAGSNSAYDYVYVRNAE